MAKLQFLAAPGMRVNVPGTVGLDTARLLSESEPFGAEEGSAAARRLVKRTKRGECLAADEYTARVCGTQLPQISGGSSGAKRTAKGDS